MLLGAGACQHPTTYGGPLAALAYQVTRGTHAQACVPGPATVEAFPPLANGAPPTTLCTFLTRDTTVQLTLDGDSRVLEIHRLIPSGLALDSAYNALDHRLTATYGAPTLCPQALDSFRQADRYWGAGPQFVRLVKFRADSSLAWTIGLGSGWCPPGVR